MKKRILIIGCFFALLIGLNFFVSHILEKERAQLPRLPESATGIVVVGERWFEFTYKGQRILLKDNPNSRAMVVIGGAE